MNAASVILIALLVAAANAQCPHASANQLREPRKYKTVVTQETIVTPLDQVETGRSNLDDSEKSLIRSTLKLAKNNGNVAPKFFLRYLQTNPIAQKYIPALANIPLRDLPKNHSFLSHSYTCMAGLHFYSQKTGQRNAQDCPVLAKVAKKYGPSKIKEVNDVLIQVLEEELGERFTREAKSAMEKLLSEMVSVVRY